MVKCPSCGKEVGDAAFCNNCGSKLHSQKNEKIKSNDFQEKNSVLTVEVKWMLMLHFVLIAELMD